jgi:hypothetical protein
MNHSAGTDFALRYARSALCGRVPVEPEMLDEIVHFLNDLNREFATGTEDYRWSGYADNCVHTLRNALAAASVWDPISVRVAKLLQLFHLAVPANEAINLAALGTMGPVDSYPRIFNDDPMRDAMLDDPRFTEVDANLRHFEEIYQQILARRDQPDGAFAQLRGDRYRRVRRRYFSVIENGLREVEQMQAGLSSPPAAGSR